MLIELGALAAIALVAAAQPAAPPPDSNPPPGVSAEDMAKIQKGVQADQATPPKEKASSGVPAAVSSAIQSVNPDIAAILDVAGSVFNHAPLEFGGHDPDHTGFTLQELELYLGAAADPFFRLDSNIVFKTDGVELEEAYATTLAMPANLQFRAGEFLTRFGRINPTHPHAWHFVDEPIVINKFLGEDGSRGVGAEVSWLSPLPWYAELIASATDPAGECCGRSFLFGGAGVRTDKDVMGTLRLEQFFPAGDDWSILFGLSAQVGANDTGPDRHTQIYGTDLYLRYRPLDSPSRTAVSFQMEALYRNRQIPGGSLHDQGGYAELIWNIVPEWETAARAEYVSGLDNDPLDPFWTSGRSRYSVQLTNYPSHFTRLRLQLSLDDPTFQEQPILGAFLALEVVVGAHGAHNY